MEESWDADNFEPKLPNLLTPSKWVGEDEEEDIKDSWEDEEEEKKDEEKVAQPAHVKPKKKLHEKIAEKERLAKEENERRLAEKEKDMTPEEKLVEKLKRQKLQEESDLRLAMETFGVTESGSGKIDSFHPSSKEEFTELADLISKKVVLFKSREEFPAFTEELVRGIIVQMGSADIRRIKLAVDNLYIEKQKVEKNDKTKKKGKAKSKIKVEGDNEILNERSAYPTYDDEYDDFI